jgi:cellulose synthase/poly-beta-1,6-N-acetylglucosamine synthase-like glycosyltransferase
MRVLVVADNCTDATAAVARAAGVEVVERHDTSRRGKGFALDFGRAHLAADSPPCVSVVDAATVPAPGALARLATRAIASGRPVQAAYTMTVDDSVSSTARFSAAAFYVKNAVRQLGASRIGAPALLTGSGMAFPWAVFLRLPLDTGHVAEDLMLGVSSSLDGTPPLFDPHAIVTSATSSDRGTEVQRRRWESGFFQVAGDHAGAVIGQGLRRGRPALAWLGLHLLTPPFLPLLALDILAILLLSLLALFGIGRGALATVAIPTALALVATLGSLLLHGRGDLLKGWQTIPRYILWKLGVTAAALFRRERSWIRTDRD